jgi:hypothetical protein
MDVAGTVAGEEDDRRREFLGFPLAAWWRERCDLIHHVTETFVHRGVYGVTAFSSSRVEFVLHL